MSWKLVHKRSLRPHRIEGITIYRNHVKCTLYIGVELQRLLPKNIPRDFCNIYEDGTKLLIQFTSKPTENSRRIHKRSINIPIHLIEDYLGRGENAIISYPRIDKGNLEIDLAEMEKLDGHNHTEAS